MAKIICTVVGTRPEIIRLSAVLKKLDSFEPIKHILIHTGQNYDYELNQIFFEDLGLRAPDYYLEAAAETPTKTIAALLAKLDDLLPTLQPDAFLVLGDTNSALASIAAKKHHIPVFHCEAGNRSFDDRVPEELNRRLVDHIADVPIYRSNQLIATTNASGMALIPNLLPYQQNPLTINPVELPFDIKIQSVSAVAVPFARSGLIVNFPVYRSRNALVMLRQRDGSVVPAGARVTVSPGDSSFIVGKRGEAYLMDLADSNHLIVQWQDQVCELILPLDPAGPSEPRIGPVTCGENP
jgi:hypothetical protein